MITKQVSIMNCVLDVKIWSTNIGVVYTFYSVLILKDHFDNLPSADEGNFQNKEEAINSTERNYDNWTIIECSVASLLAHILDPYIKWIYLFPEDRRFPCQLWSLSGKNLKIGSADNQLHLRPKRRHFAMQLETDKIACRVPKGNVSTNMITVSNAYNCSVFEVQFMYTNVLCAIGCIHPKS